MRSGFLKSFIIIGFLVLAGFILAPTYRWYYQLPEADKKLAEVTKKELNQLTESIEENVQKVRKAIGKREWYRIAKDSDSKSYVLDVNPATSKYVLNLKAEQLLKVAKANNAAFSGDAELKNSYEKAKSLLKKLDRINYFKKLKKSVIKMGLDLAGGVHFVLGINEAKLKESIENIYKPMMTVEAVKKRLLKEDPKLAGAALDKKVQERITDLKKRMDEKFDTEKNEGVSRALMKIRSRIDQFGVAEPVIRTGPQNTIIVELPGENNKEAAKEVVTRVGRLTLQLVNEAFMKTIPYSKKDRRGYIIDRDYVLEMNRSKKLPANTKFYWIQETDKFGMSKNVGYLPLITKVEMDGERITDARVEFDQTGESRISFELDGKGADIFAQVTKANTGKRLAIILDDKIQSAPSIQGVIPTGRAQITGNYSTEEAKTLAAILRSGSLPIPLKIEEERVVGPSLGADQIDRGLKSAAIALVAIFIFMVIYYRWSGLNVNLAQILNLFFIFAIMAQLGATMTLPGIAGIVLTIGMSVDANVIINERIKEELREGRSIESALIHGYHSAFRTILDSNLTTMFAAIVLALIGSGPIKGFGVTLIIGLIANLFTAIFVTHFIYDTFVYKFRVNKLSIGGGIK